MDGLPISGFYDRHINFFLWFSQSNSQGQCLQSWTVFASSFFPSHRCRMAVWLRTGGSRGNLETTMTGYDMRGLSLSSGVSFLVNLNSARQFTSIKYLLLCKDEDSKCHFLSHQKREIPEVYTGQIYCWVSDSLLNACPSGNLYIKYSYWPINMSRWVLSSGG